MHPLRPLALWLAAAIAMIAVCVLPSAARAHDGHRHGGMVVAHAATSHASAHRQVSEARIEARLTCAGPCCAAGGHVCSSCCASGLMPAAAPTFAVPPSGGPHLACDLPRPAGIVPEALPEPPRPLA